MPDKERQLFNDYVYNANYCKIPWRILVSWYRKLRADNRRVAPFYSLSLHTLQRPLMAEINGWRKIIRDFYLGASKWWWEESWTGNSTHDSWVWYTAEGIDFPQEYSETPHIRLIWKLLKAEDRKLRQYKTSDDGRWYSMGKR